MKTSTPRLTNDKTLTKLRRDTEAYFAKWIAKGGRLAAYICTSCHTKIQTSRPEPNMVEAKGYWDSVMRCTNCGNLNFVKVWPSGRTRAQVVAAKVRS